MMPIVIGRTKDLWGRTVELTDARWAHAIREHPEMTPQRPLVLATIAFPDIVVNDATHENRENFYRVVEWSVSGRPRRYLKVCVEYGPMGGTIITAFRSRGIKPGETQRWP